MNFRAMLTSRNTTLAGIALLLIAAGTLVGAYADGDPSTQPDWNLFVAEMIAAVGMFSARDADKSSQDSGVRP